MKKQPTRLVFFQRTTEPHDIVPTQFTTNQDDVDTIIVVNAVHAKDDANFSVEVAQPQLVVKKRRKFSDVEAECKAMQDKLDSYQKELELKPGSKLEDGIIVMQCVECKQFFPRNTQYFDESSYNFETCKPGRESLHNSKSHPCRKCFQARNKVRSASETGFLANLLRNYPNLSHEWFFQTVEKQNGKGVISNMVLKLCTNVPNAAGIHRLDNSLGHTPTNCVLEVQEMNAPQHKAIPCLFAAWFTIYTALARRFGPDPDLTDYVALFRKQYTKTPKELGFQGICHGSSQYDLFRSQYQFKTILRAQIISHIANDLKLRGFVPTTGRTNLINLVYPKAIAQLEAQHGRCAYTGIGLTHLREYNQISFERKDNSLPHFDQDGGLSNCVFICRIFNTAKQLSAKMILEYFLNQTMVPISEEVRAKAHEAWSHL